MITVIAGVNGAGKSSILGSYFQDMGGDYFNLDERVRLFLKNNKGISLPAANISLGREGLTLLKQAVKEDKDYVFETTLSGQSIPRILIEAIVEQRKVHILYCGLSSPELHIERVAARVANGGHSVSEDVIRKRYTTSMHTLERLIDIIDGVVVIDNSEPLSQGVPILKRLFSMKNGIFTEKPPKKVPKWATSLLEAAQKRNHTEKSKQ